MGGPVKVGVRSPPIELEQMIQQFGDMIMAPRPLSPAPVQVAQYVVYSPKAMAFFAEQRRIAQLPRDPYPMKYAISVYRLADSGVEKCFATVDSSDSRLRELAIRETEGAIDLIKEVLRLPIVEACKKAFEGITEQNMIQKWANNYKNSSFHAQDIPDFPRANPSETISEQAFFKMHPATKTVILSVPKEKIQEIGQRILSFGIPGVSQQPGLVLSEETIRRVRNLIEKMFKPEHACMDWLQHSPVRPSVTIFDGTTISFHVGHMFTYLANELSRRLIKTGMNPRLVDALIEPCIRENKRPDCSAAVLQALEKGVTGDKMGFLTS